MAKVFLKNSATIHLEEKYIEEFCSYANLPKGKIFLVLHSNSLPENNQGVCVSSQLIKFASELLGICSCSNLTKWDCCIVIAKNGVSPEMIFLLISPIFYAMNLVMRMYVFLILRSIYIVVSFKIGLDLLQIT